MKKKAVSILMTTVLCMAMLAGCGSKEAPAEAPAEVEAPAETEAPAEEEAEAASDFDSSTDISVTSREEGSGTRGAFIELFGVEVKNEAGEKVDMTTVEASVTNNTSVMMTAVAGDPYAIGYISLGSLDDTVKALKIDGVDATVENIKNGSYKVSRPFNIVTKEGTSEAALDFISFIMSAEGQEVIEGKGYIPVEDGAPAYEATDAEGKVVVGGSSSVTPVMEKLAEAYQAVNDKVTVEIQQTDSTTGVTSTLDGTYDIGMASRGLKDSEVEQGVEGIEIALDGIAVIVNNGNPMEGLTADQVRGIYVGEIFAWDEVE